jgi:integrase
MLTTEGRPPDAAGRPRSPATMPGFHSGRPPRNKGIRYAADPPRVEEIVAVMRAAGPGVHGGRIRGLIVILWRAGLRISEALSLAERDLDPERGAVLVRHGKGDKRREVGLDEWGWEQLRPWIGKRAEIPIGALFCVVNGPTARRPWSGPAARAQLRRTATLRPASAPPRARG